MGGSRNWRKATEKRMKSICAAGQSCQSCSQFTVPLMCSSVLQLLFNAADIIVVGRFAGDNSLAAVGSNSSIIALLTNLFIGLSVGANILAARFFGANDRESLSQTVHTSMLISLLSGIFLAIAGACGARTILVWMQTPSNVLDLATLLLAHLFPGHACHHAL